MEEGDEIVKIRISQIDLYVIEKVKEIRKEKKISQDHLSVLMGLSEKFVGNDISHLNLIAKALDCPVSRFIPENFLPNNDVVATYKKVFRTNKDGVLSRRYEFRLVGIEGVGE